VAVRAAVTLVQELDRQAAVAAGAQRIKLQDLARLDREMQEDSELVEAQVMEQAAVAELVP
jgi:hypothetical protein